MMSDRNIEWVLRNKFDTRVINERRSSHSIYFEYDEHDFFEIVLDSMFDVMIKILGWKEWLVSYLVDCLDIPNYLIYDLRLDDMGATVLVKRGWIEMDWSYRNTITKHIKGW